MKGKALRKLKEYKNCIMLARTLYHNVGMAPPGLSTQSPKIIDFFESLYEIGLLRMVLDSKEVNVGTRRASLDETIGLNNLSHSGSIAFVDIINHRGEILYRNPNLIRHWRHPGGYIANMVLHAYGIPISLEKPLAN